MLLAAALVLAIFFVPAPWNAVVLCAGICGETGEVLFGIWYARHRRALAGAEGMIGAVALVREACRPGGCVSYKGELWSARCASGAEVGERVRIIAFDNLALIIERTGSK